MNEPKTRPKVFISYDHATEGNKERVAGLSAILRSKGVDCMIDQYEPNPPKGWPRWMKGQIEEADFVLVVYTEIYKLRFENKDAPGQGKGVVWEGNIITQELYDSCGINTKFLTVVFDDGDAAHITDPLKKQTYFQVSAEGGRDFEKLFRELTGQRQNLPPLGPIEILPTDAEPITEARFDSPVWMVPYEKNNFFVDPDNQLDAIQQNLESQGVVALCGQPGVGKTQTASEYCWENQDSYSYVFWITADNADALDQEYLTLAKAMGMTFTDTDDLSIISARVKDWLSSRADWLLVLDNVERWQSAEKFLPKTRQGKVLMTSNQPTGSHWLYRMPVDLMSPATAKAFLSKRLGAPENSEGLDAVCEVLDYLPLALEHAGAYIESNGIDCKEYLELYREEGFRLLGEEGAQPTDHQAVTVTYAMAFRKIDNPVSINLLKVFSILAPDDIPESLFQGDALALWEGTLGELSSNVDLRNAVSAISKYSLIKRESKTKTLSLHRLLQAAVWQEMDNEERKLWTERLVKVLSAVFPEPKFENWDACRSWVPHIEHAANRIKQAEVETEYAALLLNQAACYFHAFGSYAPTEPLFKESLEIRKKVLGYEHPNTASSLNNLAGLYESQGRYSEAEPLYKKSLEVYKKVFGDEHPDTATSLNNLALLYGSHGRYSETDLLIKESLEIRKKVLGDMHPDVAASLYNLGVLYAQQRRYQVAEPLLVEALKILEAVLGVDHQNTRNARESLKNVRREMGR
ncbi:MAG: tetratricopeptide repeat protein [Candidatus Nitrohelix vancouverensis]|uniref:Tetratricopeptide repeat protein n=1 Tax=Candidatus Nitrohelix vancouverensis TaxID=2705534 RepID=A0A7T0G3X1_9BACT|nr:MAG: tetratricopeptide repeat protein [Candidatus Nitrohelix vancouverensis]